MSTVPTLSADLQQEMPTEGVLRGQRDRFTTKLAEITRKLRNEESLPSSSKTNHEEKE
jgi:hypothetical protein